MVDFGVSAIGDMGAHLVDQPFWALGLDYPTSDHRVEHAVGRRGEGSGHVSARDAAGYEFAARGDQPPVRLIWYDGGLLPVAARRTSRFRAKEAAASSSATRAS